MTAGALRLAGGRGASGEYGPTLDGHPWTGLYTGRRLARVALSLVADVANLHHGPTAVLGGARLGVARHFLMSAGRRPFGAGGGSVNAGGRHDDRWHAMDRPLHRLSRL